MAWQPNIPAASDIISRSQGDLQGDFQALNTWMAVNHILPGATNAGKHLFVEFPSGSSNGVTNLTPEVALYCNTGPVSGVPELFYQASGLGTNAGVPLTEGLNASPGWTSVGAGFLLAYGIGTTGSPGGSTTITFAPGTPAFTPFAVTMNYYNNTGSALPIPAFRLQGLLSGGFSVYSNNPGSFQVSYIAIGHR